MLNILPIKLLDSHDQVVFGANSFKLAQLKRLGLEVADGLVIAPPEFILVTTLKHLKNVGREVFEQRLEIVKAEINKIPVPSELVKEFGKNKYFLIEGKVIDQKDVWKILLNTWLEEAKNYIWRSGLSDGVNNYLTSRTIHFCTKQTSFIEAHSNEQLQDIVIKTELKLTVPQVEYIKKFVRFADNKLFLPHEYFFIKSEKILLAGLKEYTHPILGSVKEEVEIPEVQQKILVKSAVKVFIDSSSGFANLSEFDGVIIKGEAIIENYPGENMENIIHKLQTAATVLPDKPILYRLPDIVDKENIRGSLRLLYHKNLLEESLGAFLFLKNKKNITNIHIAFPTTRDPQELADIKKELAVKNISRKGSLTFWLEMGVPENIINIKEYIEIGIDGVILNLDLIHSFLGGYHIDEGQYYKHQIKTLFDFLKPAFKELHKQNIPVLSIGALTLHPEVLDYLVENGVWGVVSNNIIEAQSLPEHLNLTEKRVMLKKTKQLY